MTKKFKRFFQIILICLILVFLGLLLRSSENAWICENGEWVKHGNPSSLKPDTLCPVKETSQIKVFKPQINQEITSPLEVFGEAKGTWFFEAGFPVEIQDKQGNIVGQSIAQAQDKWITEEFIPFIAEIEFSIPDSKEGFLVLKKDNPFGLKKYDDQIKIPILFAVQEQTIVNVYFSNTGFDNDLFCNKVFPLKRKIIKTPGIARATLQELFKGPTKAEKEQGYFTSLNKDIEIQSLVIKDRIAYVDFNKQLQYQVGGSCRVAAIRAQITETLKQFPTVDEVVISINGHVKDVLQP